MKAFEEPAAVEQVLDFDDNFTMNTDIFAKPTKPADPPKEALKLIPKKEIVPTSGAGGKDLKGKAGVPDDGFEINYEDDGVFRLKQPMKMAKKTPVDPKAADRIKKLLFGSTTGSFVNSWAQGFIFSDKETLKYCLIQKEGGPCGPIATVQAHMTKHLFFLRDRRDITRTAQVTCLMGALTDILWRVRNETFTFYFVNPSHYRQVAKAVPVSISDCEYDIVKLPTKEALYNQLVGMHEAFIGEFNNGILMFLYALLLTKGPEKILQEVDSPECPLIGHHGQANQEMVNLMISGVASSNCFDYVQDLGDGMVLKGITTQCEVGFLTISESYKHLTVGKFLKNPKYPAWVIQAFGHYLSVFSKTRDCLESAPKQWDLYYFDQLDRYDKEKRITVTFDQKKAAAIERDAELLKEDGDPGKESQVDCIFKTKWHGLLLDWNDSVPIL